MWKQSLCLGVLTKYKLMFCLNRMKKKLYGKLPNRVWNDLLYYIIFDT